MPQPTTTPSHFSNRFEQFIQDQHLVEPQQTTLLAVSGGVDSVVMVDLFYKSDKSFAIAHCNFGLRGAESDADEAWVKELAATYGIKCYVKYFATKDYATKHRLSTQIAARELRYNWFVELCNQHHIEKIATAHHTNDMVETLLFNVIKGTGIAGLHGILPQQGKLIRPLLFATKNELLAYARAQNLPWREDSSNATNTYSRNLIRNQVIPLVKSINPNLEKTTYNTIQRIGQVELWFKEQLESLQKKIIRHTNDNITYVAIESLIHKPWAVVALSEMLKPFGFNFFQIQGLWQGHSSSGKRIESTTHQLYLDRGHWLLLPNPQKATLTHSYIIEKSTTNLLIEAYKFQFTISPLQQYNITQDPNIAALDMDKLTFPLLVRTWQAGDYFYPIGMQQRKKVSDFLIDKKVNVVEKRKVLVLESGGDIAWIIGHRIDNRFKVASDTLHVYQAKRLI